MYENSSFRSGIMSPHSKQTQVLRSSQSKPQTQLLRSQESQQLMIRLLMLSIEIDRKDNIIRELLMATSNNQHQMVVQQLNKKCHLYQLQIRTLTETVHMLKDNISMIQSTKNKEVFHSISQFNEELENKVYGLEAKLRKVQEEKIQLEEQLKQNKLNQSMAEFKLIKNQQTQKGKVRELQKLLSNQRVKLQIQRKAVNEKSVIIEDLKNRLIQFQNNQKFIINQYQDKFRMFKQELMYQQDLKRSQIHSNQQKQTLYTVQINRLTDQIKYLKQNIQNQRQNNKNKDKQLSKHTTQTKIIESKYQKIDTEYRQLLIKYENKINELKVKQKQLNDKENKLIHLNNQIEEVKFYFSNKNNEIEMYNQEISRLKIEISELYSANDSQKTEIRKLKRKPLNSILCQNCKLKQFGSTSAISSQKSIKSTLNMAEIIQQTQQLIHSNRRIQSMISSRQPGYQSSIQIYNQYHI